MVMEAPPSPDSVGREFVRQYYTLLNKAPTHLHRFYNNQSSFVHGGLDPPHRETLPMIGQKQIHQKIQQLNFQDCHAKITQVDAQATLGNGVVVQVTGELSNAGQPMRRFTQTFVLAAQSPKKYYVHNDIFRYQDEIISDEECDNEARSGDEGDLNQERHDMQPLNQQANLANYYNPNNAPIPPQVPQHHPAHHVMQPQQPPPPQPVMPTVNGAVHQDEIIPGNIPPPQPQQQHISNTPTIAPTSTTPPTTIITQTNQQVPVANPPPAAAVEDIPAPLVVEEGAGDGVDTKYIDNQACMKPDSPEELMSNEPISNEPKTYATLLKSGGAFPVPSVFVPSSVQPPKSVSPPPHVKLDSQPFQAANNNQQQRNNRGENRSNRTSQPPRQPRPDMRNSAPRIQPEDGSYPLDESMVRIKSLKLTDERRRSQGNNFASDSNQLFLGNLPLTATEDDLRDVFEKYGPIVDLRIHSKPSNKTGPPGARAPPNYGFITYESQQGVQACLAAKPIQLIDKTGTATVLNVEEKKIKDRPSFGGGNMRNNQGDNLSPRPPRDNNGPRRGPMPGGGQPRGSGQMGGTGGGGGGAGGGSGGGANRSNNFNRGGGGGQANRGPNNAYTRR